MVVFATILGCGCQSLPSTKPPSNSRNGVPDNGYALLLDLVGDEKDVSKLLIIKRERKELNSLVKDISRTCGDAHKRIIEVTKNDSRIDIQNQGLPPAEIAARKAISKTKAKALLTNKGKDFEIQLLLSQNEALTYGAHLAGVIADAEPDVRRGQILREIDTNLTRLQQSVLQMLLERYAWP